MTALGISLIVIGIALVSAGLMFRPAASQTVPAEPHEFRTMIDALDEEDRRSPDEKGISQVQDFGLRLAAE